MSGLATDHRGSPQILLTWGRLQEGPRGCGDATRLTYVEVLPDEQKATTVGFMLRAVSWFNSQGITCRRVLSDNGSAYRSKQWRQACTVLGLKAKRTRAYRPQTNGKAEGFI